MKQTGKRRNTVSTHPSSKTSKCQRPRLKVSIFYLILPELAPSTAVKILFPSINSAKSTALALICTSEKSTCTVLIVSGLKANRKRQENIHNGSCIMATKHMLCLEKTQTSIGLFLFESRQKKNEFPTQIMAQQNANAFSFWDNHICSC